MILVQKKVTRSVQELWSILQLDFAIVNIGWIVKEAEIEVATMEIRSPFQTVQQD